MSTESPPTAQEHPLLRMLRRKNVLAGLMFIAIAAIGLWASRNYPVGTALRMSTGYVPRLLCWLLMGLGAVVLVQGLLETHRPEPRLEPSPQDGVIAQLRPVVLVTVGLIAFALALEPLGLVIAILVLVVIASFATRELKLWETLAAAAGLSVLTWVIFILGLGLPIQMWPDW
jgi:putative tricarboxylic transport membrane protein